MKAIDEHGDDELDQALGALATHDVGAWRQQHALRRARAALDAPPRGKLGQAWDRVLEPTLVTAVCAAQLAWLAMALEGLW